MPPIEAFTPKASTTGLQRGITTRADLASLNIADVESGETYFDENGVQLFFNPSATQGEISPAGKASPTDPGFFVSQRAEKQVELADLSIVGHTDTAQATASGLPQITTVAGNSYQIQDAIIVDSDVTIDGRALGAGTYYFAAATTGADVNNLVRLAGATGDQLYKGKLTQANLAALDISTLKDGAVYLDENGVVFYFDSLATSGSIEPSNKITPGVGNDPGWFKVANANAAVADAAAQWIPNYEYIEDENEPFVATASVGAVDINGKELVPGTPYLMVYPTDQTSGATLDAAEFAKMLLIGAAPASSDFTADYKADVASLGTFPVQRPDGSIALTTVDTPVSFADRWFAEDPQAGVGAIPDATAMQDIMNILGYTGPRLSTEPFRDIWYDKTFQDTWVAYVGPRLNDAAAEADAIAAGTHIVNPRVGNNPDGPYFTVANDINSRDLNAIRGHLAPYWGFWQSYAIINTSAPWDGNADSPAQFHDVSWQSLFAHFADSAPTYAYRLFLGPYRPIGTWPAPNARGWGIVAATGFEFWPTTGLYANRSAGTPLQAGTEDPTNTLAGRIAYYGVNPGATDSTSSSFAESGRTYLYEWTLYRGLPGQYSIGGTAVPEQTSGRPTTIELDAPTAASFPMPLNPGIYQVGTNDGSVAPVLVPVDGSLAIIRNGDEIGALGVTGESIVQDIADLKSHTQNLETVQTGLGVDVELSTLTEPSNVHINSATGALTWDVAAAEDGIFHFIMNTGGESQDLVLANPTATFLRNGTANDIVAGNAITVLPGEAWIVTVTDNAGARFVNAMKVGGGSAAVATVGRGAALPADNTQFSAFVLSGHATLDGYYSWGEDAGQWIEGDEVGLSAATAAGELAQAGAWEYVSIADGPSFVWEKFRVVGYQAETARRVLTSVSFQTVKGGGNGWRSHSGIVLYDQDGTAYDSSLFVDSNDNTLSTFSTSLDGTFTYYYTGSVDLNGISAFRASGRNDWPTSAFQNLTLEFTDGSSIIYFASRVTAQGSVQFSTNPPVEFGGSAATYVNSQLTYVSLSSDFTSAGSELVAGALVPLWVESLADRNVLITSSSNTETYSDIITAFKDIVSPAATKLRVTDLSGASITYDGTGADDVLIPQGEATYILKAYSGAVDTIHLLEFIPPVGQNSVVKSRFHVTAAAIAALTTPTAVDSANPTLAEVQRVLTDNNVTDTYAYWTGSNSNLDPTVTLYLVDGNGAADEVSASSPSAPSSFNVSYYGATAANLDGPGEWNQGLTFVDLATQFPNDANPGDAIIIRDAGTTGNGAFAQGVVPGDIFEKQEAGITPPWRRIVQGGSATANDRYFVAEAALAPATAGEPTNTEIQAYLVTQNITDTLAIYTSTDVDTDPVKIVFHVDQAGVITRLDGGVNLTTSETPIGTLWSGLLNNKPDTVVLDGETFNDAEYPELAALAATMDVITDNGDGTSTVSLGDYFPRPGTTGIGNKVEDSFESHQHIGGKPVFGAEAAFGTATGGGGNDGASNWDSASTDRALTSFTGDSETAPKHFAVYYGLYGKAGIAVVDADLASVVQDGTLPNPAPDQVLSTAGLKPILDALAIVSGQYAGSSPDTFANLPNSIAGTTPPEPVTNSDYALLLVDDLGASTDSLNPDYPSGRYRYNGATSIWEFESRLNPSASGLKKNIADFTGGDVTLQFFQDDPAGAVDGKYYPSLSPDAHFTFPTVVGNDGRRIVFATDWAARAAADPIPTWITEGAETLDLPTEGWPSSGSGMAWAVADETNSRWVIRSGGQVTIANDPLPTMTQPAADAGTDTTHVLISANVLGKTIESRRLTNVERTVNTGTQGQSVAFGNFRFRVPNSGNRSLQFSTTGGTLSYSGFNTYWGASAGGDFDARTNGTVGTGFTYAHSGWHFTNHDQHQTTEFTSNGWFYQCHLTIGAGYNNNRFAMTRWRI